MDSHNQQVRAALGRLPRWHVVHWGGPGSSTLLCLWVAGRETIVPVDGGVARHGRRRYPIEDGQLEELLRSIQTEQDRVALQSPEVDEIRRRLVRLWSVDDLSAGEWPFPRGGFVRWLSNGGLHIEASDGGPSDKPLAAGLAQVLVDLGWNPPNLTHRNCWIQPRRDALQAAADLAVLTPLAAFGCDTPPVMAE